MLPIRHWDRIGNGGLRFTELGFGGAPLGNLYRAISDDDALAILEAAWDGGVRYFDTAPQYGLGLSETRMNRFFRSKRRDEFVLSSKIGRLLRAATPGTREGLGKWFEVPSRVGVFDYGYDATLRSIEFSLERLGVDRIDILYAHDLDVFSQGSQQTLDARLAEFMAGGYRALIQLRDQGVIKAFGAGVNEWQPCQWLMERGDFDLFLLAGRYTLLEQEALTTFLPMAQARGVGIVIGGPYNSGILATGPRPGAFYNYDPAPDWAMQRAFQLQQICAAHGIRLVDAAFQFPLSHPAVVSIIPGGQSVAEMAGNLAAAKARIPSDLWQALRTAGLLPAEAH
jgi:D-threo-aldose 1-dehydrogenase